METGVLIGTPGAYRLVQALPSIQVPATAQAVLAARIDRLPLDVKHLLQVAAVIGMEVPFPLLHAVAEVPTEALHRGLAQLQAAEFLYETRLFPERDYTFKHALTHEVAYGSLLQERRRALHAQIVEALSALAGDRVAEQVERLAHHALRGEVWDKALAYFRQAGERAMARSAHREAVGHFEQALGALQHLPEQHHVIEQAIDLRLALRSALLPSSHSERILACLHEAEALAAALDDRRRRGQILGFLSVHFRSRGAYAESIDSAQRALKLATAGGDTVVQALAHLYLGAAYWAQGDYRRAIDDLKQTVASLDAAQRRERFGQANLPAVQALAFLATCHAELGLFAEGQALGEEGLQIAEAVAHPSSLMWACYGLGLLFLRQGNLTRALPLLERAMHICQEADLLLFAPRMAAALAAAYTLAGRAAEAMALLAPAIQQTVATAMAGFQTLRSLPLAAAQVLAGRLESAQELAERTLTLARERQECGNQAEALRLLGEIAAQRHPTDVARSEAHYRQALTLADELGMRPLVAHCHLGLASLYARAGRLDHADTEQAAARALYHAMAMSFWLTQADGVLSRASAVSQ